MSPSPRRAPRRRPARLGVFGGTFDPPHLGHLALAACACDELGLERVLFVPAGRPPHKAGRRTPAAHRLAMARLAVRGDRAFAVDPIEVRRRGPSYAVDTLRSLAARHPGAELWFVMGADMFATLGTWREPEAIARLAHIAVAVRPGARRPRAGAWARGGRGVHWLSNPALDLASSTLRARAAAGRSLRHLVPDAVARYVERHGLYRRHA